MVGGSEDYFALPFFVKGITNVYLTDYLRLIFIIKVATCLQGHLTVLVMVSFIPNL